VRRAYRKRAKTAHPDVDGGDREAFERARRAMVLLTDPGRREKYDRTGNADEDVPDNARASALQVIAMHVGAAVTRFVQSGLNPMADHRRLDLLAVARAAIDGEIAKARAGIAAGEPVVAMLRDTAARFETEESVNALAAIFNAQADHHQRIIDGLRQAIANHELALEILARYRFRWDEPSLVIGGFAIFTQQG
jgi:curved DNA-binding protein CbpA